MRFQCAIAGHPVPWSTWDKDGIIVTPSTRVTLKERDDMRYLEIEEVCFEDAGLYRITLENDYGRIEATARLDIIKSRKSSTRGIRASSAPTSRQTRSVSRRIMGYSTKIGGRLALATQTTRASSIPSKKSIYHNGYEITSCERLSITESETEILIEISNAKKCDEGEYTLMLESEEGVITTTTFMRVLYANETASEVLSPRIEKTLKDVSSIEGLPIDLAFEVDCKVPFDYVWMKDDDVLVNSDDFT